jgi:glycosyltransferase involved in cell wall biosynthesis
MQLNSNHEFQQADILHFHAFYNLITIKRMIELAKTRPVVVTLHDQRFFTGGCHYSFSCTEYERNCTECPQVRLLFKTLPKIVLAENRKILNGMEKLTFISPSRWLAKMAGESSLLNGFPVHVIENPVPTEIFENVKRNNKNTNEKIQLGFIAENLTNPYKGLNTLLDALSQKNLADRYELNLFGRRHGLKFEENLVVRNQMFSGAQGTADALASIDVLVVPSLQDNFPSVVIEALVSGIPVIGSSIGGIPEVLNDLNMPTFEAGNVNQLTKVLDEYQEIILDKKTKEEITSRFSYKTSSASHESIYKFILR